MAKHLTTGDGDKSKSPPPSHYTKSGPFIRQCALCKDYLSYQIIEMEGDYDITSGYCETCLELTKNQRSSVKKKKVLMKFISVLYMVYKSKKGV